jgi:hypothetical protein
MAKARGLPDTFKLNVSAAMIGGKPVELGDYLDEDPPAPTPKPQTQTIPAAPESAPVLRLTPQEEPRTEEPSAPPPDEKRAEKPAPRLITSPSQRTPAPPAPARTQAPTSPARLRTTVPRKQVNMNPETLNMVDQLMDYVQTYSVEKNLKASELFNALVLGLYEAREHIDLSRVQPRGRWGTPTAAALPIALKNAFQRAIRKYNEEVDS